MADKPLIEKIVELRQKRAESILDFDFKKKRVRILAGSENVMENSKGVLYWMSREFRVQDNWNMLFAQKLALKNKIPLHVVFFLLPKFLDASVRHYKFLLNGLKEVKEELESLNITFHLYPGWPYEHLPRIVKENKIGAVVCDFFPLRLPMKWQEDVIKKLPIDVPLVQVDGHNIVPCWVASDKQEYAARTIRNKITSKLDTFLTEFPPVIKHPHEGKIDLPDFDWEEALEKCEINQSMPEVTWCKPGYKGGIEMLESFCKNRLKNFATKRNDPNIKALSNLSPWLHFGQISAQRCILEVKRYSKNFSESVAAYCEEAIVRRELGDNFCFYNPNYDNLDGAANWARTTLNDHRKDKRTYIYTRDELANAQTHDALWNSAQLELVKEGKMHGFMRMYWAKKILEWTESPEQALEFGIYLNDHYSMDGRDPNGYTGVMWSICGIHDQGWAERNIFGKIRYMNYDGCKRKFDINKYIIKWGGKEHKHKANGPLVKLMKNAGPKEEKTTEKSKVDKKESKSDDKLKKTEKKDNKSKKIDKGDSKSEEKSKIDKKHSKSDEKSDKKQSKDDEKSKKKDKNESKHENKSKNDEKSKKIDKKDTKSEKKSKKIDEKDDEKSKKRENSDSDDFESPKKKIKN